MVLRFCSRFSLSLLDFIHSFIDRDPIAPRDQAFGAKGSSERSEEVARRLAAGEPVCRACEVRALGFLKRSFQSALAAYPTTLGHDIQLLQDFDASEVGHSATSIFASCAASALESGSAV